MLPPERLGLLVLRPLEPRVLRVVMVTAARVDRIAMGGTTETVRVATAVRLIVVGLIEMVVPRRQPMVSSPMWVVRRLVRRGGAMATAVTRGAGIGVTTGRAAIVIATTSVVPRLFRRHRARSRRIQIAHLLRSARCASSSQERARIKIRVDGLLSRRN